MHQRRQQLHPYPQQPLPLRRRRPLLSALHQLAAAEVYRWKISKRRSIRQRGWQPLWSTSRGCSARSSRGYQPRRAASRGMRLRRRCTAGSPLQGRRRSGRRPGRQCQRPPCSSSSTCQQAGIRTQQALAAQQRSAGRKMWLWCTDSGSVPCAAGRAAFRQLPWSTFRQAANMHRRAVQMLCAAMSCTCSLSLAGSLDSC